MLRPCERPLRSTTSRSRALLITSTSYAMLFRTRTDTCLLITCSMLKASSGVSQRASAGFRCSLLRLREHSQQQHRRTRRRSSSCCSGCRRDAEFQAEGERRKLNASDDKGSAQQFEDYCWRAHLTHYGSERAFASGNG